MSSFTDVSCPTATFSTDTAGGTALYNGATWTVQAPITPRGVALVSVSCPSAAFCTAMDGFSQAFTYNGAWSAPDHVDPQGDSNFSGITILRPIARSAITEYCLCMGTSRYWPFGVRSAYISSLIMVPILLALAVWLYRPQGPLAIRLTFAPLLVAVLLGLVPVILVILGGVRSVEAAGVTVAFAAVQDVVSTSGVITARSLIADNLGNPPGSVMDSGSDNIIDSLKDAVGNYCVVIDLKEGEEWWETRLLVLVSGAVRRGFPKAVVFTCATADQARSFLGWSNPSELLRRILARDPVLSDAFQDANRDWMLWQLGAHAQHGAQRILPWAPSGKMQTYLAPDPSLAPLAQQTATGNYELPWPSTDLQSTPWVMREDGFEAERLLLSRLAPHEIIPSPWSLTEARVRELFGSVLHTGSVDPQDDEATWVEMILGSTADFFAVTRGHQFVNLVPRRTAVNAVLLAMVYGSGKGGGGENPRRRQG